MSCLPNLILHSARPVRRGFSDSAESPVESEFARNLVLQQPRVARLVQRLLGWPLKNTWVDDIVQEVMVSAWLHRARFRGDSQLGTWVARIAINEVRRHQRRRRIVERLFRRHRDLTSIPQTEALRDERREQLRLELAGLPHRDREILILHYLEGQDVAAMAQLLDLSVSAVHARMSRARERLREAIDRRQRTELP